MKWESMATAPKNETVIRVRLDGGEYYAYFCTRRCTGSCSPPYMKEHELHYHHEWNLCMKDGEDLKVRGGSGIIKPSSWRPLR